MMEDNYKDLKARLDMLISDSHALRDEIRDEIARLKVNQHKIEEKVAAIENIVDQIRKWRG